MKVKKIMEKEDKKEGISLRSIREYLGLTQEVVAKHLDVAVTTVHRWENHHCSPQPKYKRLLTEFYISYGIKQNYLEKIFIENGG